MPDAIGAWRIRDVDPGGAPVDEVMRGAGDGWIAADVPGDTYRALIAAGRLADPYTGRNEAAAAWVREREWWWHAPLELGARDGDESIDLVFDGLDTFADVHLDGVLLGRADNMFRAWRFDLSGIAAGRHDLAVRFHPATAMTGDAPLQAWSSFADRITRSRRPLMRKAQFGWGWDWGPDLPTVGIWRPVRIERRRGPVVTRINAATRAVGHDHANVTVSVDLSDAAAVDIVLFDPVGNEVARGRREGSGDVDLAVRDPQLWWTADLGDRPLYTLVASPAGGAERRVRVGLRTIAIDESADPAEPGSTFFRFVLNGVPIFARGANWVPASSFVGAIPDATYRDLLARAVAANMNMIRVWGGGIYESDLFYDECDRLGLLVWQDFMFACAPYPDDDGAFVANVRAEVTEQVGRLAHHPCLALWCGNNENQALQWFDELAGGPDTPLPGLSLYDRVIPELLAALDPATPYRPTSPWGGATPNSMRAGDVHDWTVWHGIPPVPDAVPVGGFDRSPAGLAYTRYAENEARFVSEFGIQATPDIGTLRRWLAPEDLRLGSDGLLKRIKDVADKIGAMMAPVTGLPTKLDQFVDFSMLTQAEGLGFGIEHFRRRAPHCSGALIWQLNDCWPCVSWSLIDYDGVAKASFDAVRRAFAPVMASFRRTGDGVELWIVNDRLNTLDDDVLIARAWFDGRVETIERLAVTVPPLGKACLWRGAAMDATDHALIVRSDAGTFPSNRLLLAPIKDLALTRDPGLAAQHERVGSALRVTIRAERYAMAVALRSDDPALRFDNNHVDLAGGEAVATMVTHRDGQAVDPDALVLSSWNEKAA